MHTPRFPGCKAVSPPTLCLGMVPRALRDFNTQLGAQPHRDVVRVHPSPNLLSLQSDASSPWWSVSFQKPRDPLNRNCAFSSRWAGKALVS